MKSFPKLRADVPEHNEFLNWLTALAIRMELWAEQTSKHFSAGDTLFYDDGWPGDYGVVGLPVEKPTRQSRATTMAYGHLHH